MMRILAKPVDQAFVINPEKAEEFLNRKADPKVKEMILKRAEKLKKQREKFSSFEETEPDEVDKWLISDSLIDNDESMPLDDFIRSMGMDPDDL